MQSTLHSFVRPASAAPVVSKDSVPSAATAPALHLSHLESSYRVDVRGISAAEVACHTKALTMTPKDFGGGFGGTVESFNAYHLNEEQRTLSVPRFYGLEHFGAPAVDDRRMGKELGEGVAFASLLSESQMEAHEAVLASLHRPAGGCILQRKAGGGKTVIGLATIKSIGRRTIVFSHKTDLLDQWRDRMEQHLPGATVGRIQQNRVDVEADVVLATLQSVALREYDSGLFDGFGLAVFDEAHHMGARHFFRVLEKIRPRYILGLTATPERRDGLSCLLAYGMGPLVTAGSQNDMGERVTVDRLIYTGGAQRELKVRGTPCIPMMINDLARDLRRTLLIVEEVARLYSEDRRTIVLSDRIAHLKEICAHLTGTNDAGPVVADVRVPPDEIGFYISSTSAKERVRVRERAVILATFSMAKEGLDIPRLDAEVLATPIGDPEQAVGRIQRPCEEKQPPVLVDIVDPFSVFQFTAKKRRRFYEAKDFEIRERNVA